MLGLDGQILEEPAWREIVTLPGGRRGFFCGWCDTKRAWQFVVRYKRGDDRKRLVNPHPLTGVSKYVYMDVAPENVKRDPVGKRKCKP